MTTILLQSVGTGGPDNPVWEALAFTVRRIEPHVLVQLCSSLTFKETVPKFNDLMSDNMPPRISRDVADDEENLEKLTFRYAKIIEGLRAEHPQARFEVDFTSGTKAMSAALVAAAISRQAARLHYATGPRNQAGRTTRTTHLVSLNSDQLVADHRLLELGELFDQGQFLAVQRESDHLATTLADTALRDRASTLAFMAKAYADWDRFNWSDAFAMLRTYRQSVRKEALEKSGWPVDRIGAQVGHLKSCRNQPDGSPPTPERLADLWANADRCISAGRFDDAVARLYRLIEYIGQACLIARHGLRSTRNLSVDTLRKLAPKYTADRYLGRKTVDLGLRDNIEVLAEAGDPVGSLLKSFYDGKNPVIHGETSTLKQLLDNRNNSLLAHGSAPISKNDAERLLKAARSCLQLHLDHLQGDSGVKLDSLLDAARFLHCPWSRLPSVTVNTAVR
jgi:CRISPR-associated protein (TIGR02710 family)